MADFSEQGSPAAAAQNGPDVYVLPLTEVSLPMAKQPGRSGKRTCLPPRIVSWSQQAVEVCGSLRTRDTRGICGRGLLGCISGGAVLEGA